MKRARAVVACAVASAACGGGTSARPAFRDVAASVEQRAGLKVYWNTSTTQDKAVADAIASVLARELSANDAIYVALLNNRDLQATFEELSVSQADLVQAGLLHNPVLGVGVGISSHGGGVEPEFSVVQDLLDVFMLSARKKMAAAELEATKLRVAEAAIELGNHVETAYYAAQAAMQITAMRRTVADAAGLAADMAERQREAGNLSDLDRANQLGLAQQARLDLTRSEAEVLTTRERLTRLLGLWGTDANYRIASKLAEVPAEEPTLERLESLAVTQRLDIALAKQEVEVDARALALAQNFRYTGGVSVGASASRSVHHDDWTAGPNVGLELPVFDQRQAAIARLSARRRQSEQRLHALAVSARSEVREARGRLIHTRDVSEYYRKVMIPLREEIVALSQQQYDAMLLGVYQLLLAKQNEVNSYREYIESVRDYWIARAELSRAVGGRLPAKADGSQPTPEQGP